MTQEPRGREVGSTHAGMKEQPSCRPSACQVSTFGDRLLQVGLHVRPMTMDDAPTPIDASVDLRRIPPHHRPLRPVGFTPVAPW